MASASNVPPQVSRKSKSGHKTWTSEQHRNFVRAVDALGGATEATARKIQKHMSDNGDTSVTYTQIKGHLHVYRSNRRKDEALQDIITAAEILLSSKDSQVIPSETGTTLPKEDSEEAATPRSASSSTN